MDASMQRTRRQLLTDDFQRGYDQGWKDGYEQGIKSGKRLAKGKSAIPKRLFSKRHGRPPVLDPILLVPQFVNFVNDRMHTEGVSLPAAVSKYRGLMGRVWKGIREVPDQEQLLRVYKRATRPKLTPGARPIK
jgi:hypothetical protein